MLSPYLIDYVLSFLDHTDAAASAARVCRTWAHAQQGRVVTAGARLSRHERDRLEWCLARGRRPRGVVLVRPPP